MGVIVKPALQELANIVNEAGSTKEVIIKTAEFDQKFKRAKEIQEQIVEEEVKNESFEFRPEDVQTLVNRNEFKERYVVRDEDKLTHKKSEDEIIHFNTREQKDDIENEK